MPANLLQQLQAIVLLPDRHHEISHQHITLQPLQMGQQFIRATGLGNYRHSRYLVEDGLQADTKDRMIVSQDDTQWRQGGSTQNRLRLSSVRVLIACSRWVKEKLSTVL
ncbi:hypothetical protein D3C84_655290 [compost metagenome]